MFTGIVEAVGRIEAVTESPNGYRLQIATEFTDELSHGQSVSVDGACLTVETITDGTFDVFLSEETITRTHLQTLDRGDQVNLERAMPATGRFDGHFVQGHVDTTTEITAINPIGDDWEFEFAIPHGYERYLIDKGSITIDGISLTIAELSDDTFTVAIIPTTYNETALSTKQLGDPVHIEVDLIAKYVERLLEQYPIQ